MAVTSDTKYHSNGTQPVTTKWPSLAIRSIIHCSRFPTLLQGKMEDFKARWSLYVPYSGHYMYRTVVTICTAQWSLYVQYSGHYMYRTVVTICTEQWSLYVPHSGHYMYRTVVTICTASLTFNNSTFHPRSVSMCFFVDLRTNSDYFPIQH